MENNPVKFSPGDKVLVTETLWENDTLSNFVVATKGSTGVVMSLGEFLEYYAQTFSLPIPNILQQKMKDGNHYLIKFLTIKSRTPTLDTQDPDVLPVNWLPSDILQLIPAPNLYND
jgi:hypothetical protein